MVNSMEFKDVGEGLTEGEVLEIKVSEGDHVNIDDVLMEVETDKAIVDIPSNFEGIVQDVTVSEGEVIEVGEVLVKYKEKKNKKQLDNFDKKNTDSVIGTNINKDSREEREDNFISIDNSLEYSYHIEEDIDDLKKWWRKNGEGDKIDKGDIKNYSLDRINQTESSEINSFKEKTPCDKKARRLAFRENVLVDEVYKMEDVDDFVTQEDVYQYLLSKKNSVENIEQKEVKATPKARSLASKKDIDISDIDNPSGKNNGDIFVTHRDVKDYKESKDEEIESQDSTKETIDYSGVRKSIGNHMEESYRNKPHVNHHDYVDATNLLEFKDKINEHDEFDKITITPILTKICSKALQEYPIFNSKLDKKNNQIIINDKINIGIATETKDGLKVPVVTNTDQKYIKDLSEDISKLAQKCRNGKITPSELQGQTFSITNIGVIGGTYATPIINGDDVAIIAFGEIKEEITSIEGELETIYKLPISLAFDHRVADGAEAARFVNKIKKYIKNPELVLIK